MAPIGNIPRRVLLVENHDENREVLSELLKVWGYEVADVGTGAVALARALWFRPDVAIIDLGLPGMDGCTLARAFQAPPWGQPDRPLLIAYTGWGRPEDRQRAEEAGFDVFLLKPAPLDELQAIVAGVQHWCGSRPSASSSTR